MKLENKVALVTGAARGIGKAIAKALAAEGAVVIVNYNGSAQRAAETVKEIEEAGGKALAICCNVADFTACKDMIDGIIKEQGRLDILVNNAGITRDGLLMKMSEEDFDSVMDTNLKGAFNCIRHAARQMIKQKSGRIISISSVSGVLGNAGQANYSASMTEVLSEVVKTSVTETIPMKKFGKPEDIAQTALFLASEEAAYITGQVICVDGGMAM